MNLIYSFINKLTLPLREGWLWLYQPKIQFNRYVRWASIQYRHLPIHDQTRQTHLRLLSKYAPWILRAAYGHEYSRPVTHNPMVTKEDIEQFIGVDSELKLHCSSRPIISVIIPIYGKIDYTIQCLASIALNPSCVPYEIIVVDDCSPDNSVEILSHIEGIRILVNSENLGFIRSCNIGAQGSVGEFLCFLNNDTEVTRGWLDELFNTFSEFPGTGLSGSKLIYPDGTLQEAGGIIWQDGSACNFGRNNDQWRPAYNYAREVDYCSGASIMVPKKLFESLGGFDEHYLPAYCEDSDLALKIRESGHRVIYQPLSVVIHYEGVTSGTDTTQGTKTYQVENSRKLFQRWKEHLHHHQSPGMDIDYAKDRMSKHRVLILDHCTPTPDQDAGSVTVFNLMLLLREMNFQVTFIPESNFLYLPGYTSALQRAGIEVLYSPYCTSVLRHLKVAGNRYDLIFMFRPTVVERHIKAVRRHCARAKVLFHTVDLHFLRMSREADLLDSPSKRKFATEMKQRELAAIRTVDSSIVHSTSELELLRLELPLERIQVFPLIMDIQGTEKGFNDRRDLIFLGGYKHTPNVDAVKYFVSDVMPFLRQRLPGVCFYVVGSHPPAEIFALQAEDVIVTGFVEDLNPLLDKMRISVAPLRYGAGIKGKIGTAMAAGLPVIATSLAAEGMSLSSGQNILVADGAEEFAEAVVQLYGDEILWGKLSRNGLDFAEKVWGAESSWETLNHILIDLGIPSVRGKYPLRLYFQKTTQKLHPVGVCRSKAEFEQLLSSDIFEEIASLENKLITQSGESEFFTVSGYCSPCKKTVSFRVDMIAGGYYIGGQRVPNWREQLVCPICHMINRQRLIATLVEQHLNVFNSSDANIYFMEQVTPIYKWAKKTFLANKIIGSEFLGQNIHPGKVVKGIRHEDLTALSFEDNSINLIVSNDVFEHVSDPSLAFRECVRVLQPGGIMLATIPFHSNIDVSVTRSILGNDGITHSLPPMYHGNPMSEDGSLVFTDFGWDLLETMKECGFKDVTCELFASQEFCHLGGGQIVFRAVKGSTSVLPRNLPDKHLIKMELQEKPSAIVSIMGEVLWHSLTIDPTIEDISKKHLETIETILRKYYRRPKSRRRLRVLEIAAYAHTTGDMLSKKIGADVVLTDISVDTLALGCMLAESNGYGDALVKRIAADFHELPFSDEQFDLVYISSALHHTWDWQGVLKEMIRVVVPGGLLYLDNEPCLREFCFYKFRTNRPDVFRPIEKCLEESGIIRTVAQPYLGSRPEALFGMVENQIIPLEDMLNLLEHAGKIEKIWLSPEMCMRDFELNLVKKRKNGNHALEQIIVTSLLSNINKAKVYLGVDDIALGYCLPTDTEVYNMASKIAHRLSSLRGFESSDLFRIELSKIFGSGVSVLLRKDGVLPDYIPELKMLYSWGERKGITIGYSENVQYILSTIQDILPNIQTTSDLDLRKSFPEEDWRLEKFDNGLRYLTPKLNGSRIFCFNVQVTGRLQILIRIHALFYRSPYRIHLEVNGKEVSCFDVYQTESFLFNNEIDIPATDFLLKVIVSSLDTGLILKEPQKLSISVARLCAIHAHRH